MNQRVKAINSCRDFFLFDCEKEKILSCGQIVVKSTFSSSNMSKLCLVVNNPFSVVLGEYSATNQKAILKKKKQKSPEKLNVFKALWRAGRDSNPRPFGS